MKEKGGEERGEMVKNEVVSDPWKGRKEPLMGVWGWEEGDMRVDEDGNPQRVRRRRGETA